MPKLLVFTEAYARGGGNRYMVDVTNALAPTFDDIVLATNPGGLFAEDVARIGSGYTSQTVAIVTRGQLARRLNMGPPVLRKLALAALILLEPAFMLINVIGFIRLLRRLRPHYVLSCNGGYPAAEATLALVMTARLCRIPCVLTIVSMPSDRRWYMLAYDWLVDHLVWHTADAVVVNADLIAKALVARRGARPATLAVLHNGIEDQPLMARHAQPDAIVLGCVARLDRMKGVMVLLDAFALLAGRFPQLRLVYVGSGDSDDDMRRRTGELGLDSRVDYLGHYSGDIATLLAGFDVFVFPSLWEGFPYSIVEAMRSGMPIVSTDVGGIPEAITTDQNGILVDPGSASALAAALERLLLDPALAARLGDAARATFERDLSLQQMHRRARQLLADGLERAVA